MGLYEITNGYVGESYLRVYAWAESEEQALEMARQRLQVEDGYPAQYAENLRIELLFDAQEPPFVTDPSSTGFERSWADKRFLSVEQYD
ncbi:MAG: hypothetical protein DCC55_11410 [Chloroflexi bacterium]|nr:MAG: hypothetical protein DCC55_11410 [Chloroflexota bacterium]